MFCFNSRVFVYSYVIFYQLILTIQLFVILAVQAKHRADTLINGNHYDPQSIKDISEEVTKRWQQLVTCAEERHKLVTASLNFYKTAEQVCFIFVKPNTCS